MMPTPEVVLKVDPMVQVRNRGCIPRQSCQLIPCPLDIQSPVDDPAVLADKILQPAPAVHNHQWCAEPVPPRPLEALQDSCYEPVFQWLPHNCDDRIPLRIQLLCRERRNRSNDKTVSEDLL